MKRIIKHIRNQNALRKFRNNLTKGQKVLIRFSDIEAFEAPIIFVSKLEKKVVIHTKGHPYEGVEFSKVFPLNSQS